MTTSLHELIYTLLSEKNNNEIINHLYDLSNDDAKKVLTYFNEEKLQTLFIFCTKVYGINLMPIYSKEQYIDKIMSLNKEREFLMFIKYEYEDLVNFFKEYDINDVNVENKFNITLTIKNTLNRNTIDIVLNSSYWSIVDDNNDNNDNNDKNNKYYYISLETHEDIRFNLNKNNSSEKELIKFFIFLENIKDFFKDNYFLTLNTINNFIFSDEIIKFIKDEKNKAIDIIKNNLFNNFCKKNNIKLINDNNDE